MRLFDYRKKEDFGVEHMFTVIRGKRRSFLQFSFDWDENPGFPYIQISFGNNCLVNILFWCWKLGLSFELFGYTWYSWDS